MDDRTRKELRDSQAGLGLQEEVVGAALPDEGGVVRRAPHKEPQTPREWIRENLFSSPFNGLLTIVFGLFGLAALYQILTFLFFTGEWEVFRVNFRSYMAGRFPLEEMWRPWIGLYLVSLLSGLTAGAMGLSWRWKPRRIAIAAVVAAFVLMVFIYAVDTLLVWLLTLAVPAVVAGGFVVGGAIGARSLRPLAIAWILIFPALIVLLRAFGGVPPRLWGGFMLNLVVAFVGIVVSFPIGLLLALGRRSTLPAVRWFSIAVIELVRGNPLYILLIAGNFLLPLLLPPGWDFPLIIRAMAIYVIFSSAYVAEIVRGGLQGLHYGQYEASRALGLPYSRMMALVILPQALRSTIPAMISHFISLFKDTSLLAVVGGFTETLRAARRASVTLGEAGNSMEALLPAALLFFVVAYSMSKWSQRIERRVGVGER